MNTLKFWRIPLNVHHYQSNQQHKLIFLYKDTYIFFSLAEIKTVLLNYENQPNLNIIITPKNLENWKNVTLYKYLNLLNLIRAWYFK